MRKIGSIQNFFRSRIKDQSSIKVDTIQLLKLPRHAFGRRPRRLPGDPISGRAGSGPQAQKIFAHAAQHPSERRKDEIEQDAKNERIDNRVKQRAESGPGAVQGRENFRRGQRGEQRRER